MKPVTISDMTKIATVSAENEAENKYDSDKSDN